MRTFAYFGPRSMMGAGEPNGDKDHKTPKPTLKKDGYVVTASVCDDPSQEYMRDRRRGSYLSPTRDHLFKPEDDDQWN